MAGCRVASRCAPGCWPALPLPLPLPQPLPLPTPLHLRQPLRLTLQRLMGFMQTPLQSAHCILSTIFLVVLAFLWNTGLV
jgi:hypothetical protein